MKTALRVLRDDASRHSAPAPRQNRNRLLFYQFLKTECCHVAQASPAVVASSCFSTRLPQHPEGEDYRCGRHARLIYLFKQHAGQTSAQLSGCQDHPSSEAHGSDEAAAPLAPATSAEAGASVCCPEALASDGRVLWRLSHGDLREPVIETVRTAFQMPSCLPSALVITKSSGNEDLTGHLLAT